MAAPNGAAAIFRRLPSMSREGIPSLVFTNPNLRKKYPGHSPAKPWQRLNAACPRWAALPPKRMELTLSLGSFVVSNILKISSDGVVGAKDCSFGGHKTLLRA